jgi:hypothetical protein
LIVLQVKPFPNSTITFYHFVLFVIYAGDIFLGILHTWLKTVYANGMPDGFCNKADNKKYPTFQG